MPGVIEQILDLARWAPSGDNTQPWRFEICGELTLVIHGFDTRDRCVYDLDGRASQISIGALLETMSIAASGHGLQMQAIRRQELPETTPTFDVQLQPRPELSPDPLAEHIPLRCVQRRAMSAKPLSDVQKSALESSVGHGYRLHWFEGLADRWRVASLMFANAELRLTMPEAYRVHRDIIEWNAQFSEGRVPDQALGVDPVTLKLMRFVLGSWKRVQFFNRFLAGTLAPRLQMDLIPGLACAAHVAMEAKTTPQSIDDFVAAGRAMQRLWLTATSLGLQHQPEVTPLIFGSYVRRGIAFTEVVSLQLDACQLEARARRVLSVDLDRVVWMGRIGAGRRPGARSLRRPLRELMWRLEVPVGGDAPALR